VSNAPSKPVSFSRPKVGYFSNRPRILKFNDLLCKHIFTPTDRLCKGISNGLTSCVNTDLHLTNRYVNIYVHITAVITL